MNHPQQDHFATRARDLYQRAGPRVDATIAARLRSARRAALADVRPAHRHLRWAVPVGACAVALLLVTTVWQPLRQSARMANVATVTLPQAGSTDVLPPDAGQTDPTLYQNLGFYAWLARQPNAPPQAASGH